MTAPSLLHSTSLDPLAELNARTKLLPGQSYKLADGYGLDVAFTGQLDIDEKKMAVWVPYADGNRRDGVGDLLVVEGIDESRHRKNPIHLFDHGKSVTLPVGKVEDPETGRYTGIIDPVTKVAKDLVYYYQGTGLPGVNKSDEYDHALFCQQVFHLLAQKFIRGGSIGYQVLQARELPPEPQYGTPKGLLLIAVLKLESSTVVMPANADTVRKGLAPDLREVLAMSHVCGKPLSPMLVKSLTPFASPKKAQMGYEGKSDISQIIKEETSKYGGVTRQCNEEGGYCTDIAIDVARKLSGARVVRSYRGHDFISYQGRYYDAESPNGVDSPEKLPYFIRHPEHAQRKAQLGYEGKAGPMKKALPTFTSQQEVDRYIDTLKGKPKAELRQILIEAGFTASEIPVDEYSMLSQLRYEISPEGRAAPPGGGGRSRINWRKSNQSEVSPDAATVNARQPYQMAQDRTASRPAMGVRQQADGYYVYDPTTGQDQFGPFFSEGIALRWAQRLNMGRKGIKELRKKYRRTAKGLVRRLKKSSPGSGIVYMAGKDMEKARKEAEAKGIKFQHVGSRNGTAKVKLIGDDGAIDEVAKSYGRLVKFQGAKSLKGTKANPLKLEIIGIGKDGREYARAPNGDVYARSGSFPDDTTGWRFESTATAWASLGAKVRGLEGKSIKANQGLRSPFQTNINAATAGEGDVVVARRAIMDQTGREYFAQPGDRLTIVGVDAGQMRVRNRAGVEKLVTSNDVRRKAMGTKAKRPKYGEGNPLVGYMQDMSSRESWRIRYTIIKPDGTNKEVTNGGFASKQEADEFVNRNMSGANAQFVYGAGPGLASYVNVRVEQEKSIGVKANPLTLIMVGDEVEVIPGSGGHTQYHGGDRGIVKEVRSTGYVIQIPGEPRPTAFEKDEVKLVRKKSMVLKALKDTKSTRNTRTKGTTNKVDWDAADQHQRARWLLSADSYLHGSNARMLAEHEWDSLPLDVRRKLEAVRGATLEFKDTKSMRNTKKKDGDDLPVGDEATTASGEERELPLGAQVLRRLHEDASLLLQDYDEMLGPLENESVKARLQSKAEAFAEELAELEEEYGKLYPDLDGLVGTKDGELEEAADLEGDGEPDNDKEEYEDALEATPKDMDTMDDNAVGSSSEEREEVPVEEALEGMETADEEMEEKSLRRKVKYLRKKYRGKGMCPECQREDCVCEVGETGEKIAPALVAAAAPAVGQLVGSALTPKDKGYVKEAGGFLGEMGQPDSILDDEGRMKSYHYHKTLEGMAQLEEARNDLEEGSEDLQDSGIPPAEFEPGAGAKGVGSAAAAVARHPRVRAAARGAVRGAVEGATTGKAVNERQRTDTDSDGGVRDERGAITRAISNPSPDPEPGKPAEISMKDGPLYGPMDAIRGAGEFLKELAFLPEMDDDHRTRSTEFSKGLNDFLGSDEEAPVEEDGDPEGVVMEEEVMAEEEPGMEVKFLADEADLQNRKIAELSRVLSKLPI